MQMILEDFGRYGDTNPFYKKIFGVDIFGRVGASLEAKLLLPLKKTLAYGLHLTAFVTTWQGNVANNFLMQCATTIWESSLDYHLPQT
jgi:hypothetical protein